LGGSEKKVFSSNFFTSLKLDPIYIKSNSTKNTDEIDRKRGISVMTDIQNREA
jgi:hypothetical protein